HRHPIWFRTSLPQYSTVNCGNSTTPGGSTQRMLHLAQRAGSLQTLENVVVRSVFGGIREPAVNRRVEGSNPSRGAGSKPRQPKQFSLPRDVPGCGRKRRVVA